MADGTSISVSFILTTLLVQNITCTDSKPLKTISGEEGSTLALACPDCSCEIPTNVGKLSSWHCRRGGHLFTLSVNCSRSQINVANASERVTVNKNTFTLTIEPLQYDDEGDYTCQCYKHVTRYSVFINSESAPSLWYVWLIVGVALLLSMIIGYKMKTWRDKRQKPSPSFSLSSTTRVDSYEPPPQLYVPPRKGPSPNDSYSSTTIMNPYSRPPQQLYVSRLKDPYPDVPIIYPYYQPHQQLYEPRLEDPCQDVTIIYPDDQPLQQQYEPRLEVPCHDVTIIFPDDQPLQQQYEPRLEGPCHDVTIIYPDDQPLQQQYEPRLEGPCHDVTIIYPDDQPLQQQYEPPSYTKSHSHPNSPYEGGTSNVTEQSKDKNDNSFLSQLTWAWNEITKW